MNGFNINVLGITPQEFNLCVMQQMIHTTTKGLLERIGMQIAPLMPRFEEKERGFGDERITILVTDDSEGDHLSRVHFKMVFAKESGVEWDFYIDKDGDWSLSSPGVMSTQDFYTKLSPASKALFLSFFTE